MFETLLTPLYFWLFLGLFLVIVEFLIPSFFIIFFGFGAWITALVAGLFPQSPLWLLIVVFIGSSLTLLILLRSKFAPLFKGDEKSEVESNYCGMTGEVTEAIEANGRGKIKMSGTTWNATSTEKIAVGEAIVVVKPIPHEPLSFIVSKK